MCEAVQKLMDEYGEEKFNKGREQGIEQGSELRNEAIIQTFEKLHKEGKLDMEYEQAFAFLCKLMDMNKEEAETLLS